MSGIQEILVGPSRRWREDALRNIPYMGQKIKGQTMKVRQRIRSVRLSRKRLFADVADLFPPTLSGRGFSIDALISPIYRIREVRETWGNREVVVDW